MSSTVGEVKIALKLDGSGLNAGAGKTLGSAFGNSWTVAAGNLISAGLQKLLSTAVNVGKSILETGMNYESAMSEVKAISGATADEMERLENKGIESASTSVFTCEQTAEAYKYMGMAGWDAGQMIDGLDGILNLAAASNLDLATTSDIVTDALTAFGYKAKDSGHFADVLARTATNANTDVAMMGETFKYVGAVAGSMHYSIEDVGVAIGLMANSGIKASQAGTSLRGIITRLAKPTSTMLDVLKKLNVSLYDSTGKARPLSDVMIDLRKSFSGLTDAQKAEYATTIAGKNALTGMLAIINASDEDYKKLTQSINNADGAAEEMANTMLDNLSGAIKMVSSSWNSAITELSRGNLDKFAQYSEQAVDGIVKIVENSGPSIANAIVALTRMVIRQAPRLAGAFFKMATTIMAEVIKQLPGLIGELGTAIGKMFGGNEFIGPIVGALGTVFGVTLLARLKPLKLITNAFGGIVDAVSQGIGSVLKGIGTIIGKLFEPLGSASVLKGAASATLIAASIWILAKGIQEVCAINFDLGKLLAFSACMVVAAAIMALVGTFGVYAGIGAIASAVVGGGLLLTAIAIEETSKRVQNIDYGAILAFEGVMAVVSLILAAISGFATLGAVGSIASSVVAGGLLVASLALEETSKHAKNIDKKAIEDLSWVIAEVDVIMGVISGFAVFGAIGTIVSDVIAGGVKFAAEQLVEATKYAKQLSDDDLDTLENLLQKIASWETGGLLHNIENMLNSGALREVADNVVEIVKKFAEMPEIPNLDTIEMLKEAIYRLSLIQIDGGGFFDGRGAAAAMLETIVGYIVSINHRLSELVEIDYGLVDNFIIAINKFEEIRDTARQGLLRLDNMRDSFGNLNWFKFILGDLNVMPEPAARFVQAINKFALISDGARVGALKLSQMKDGLSNIDWIKHILGDIPKTIVENANRFVAAINKFNGVSTEAEKLQGIADAMNKMKDAITNSLKDLPQTLKTSANEAITQFIAGITERHADTYTQGAELANKFYEGLKSIEAKIKTAGASAQGQYWAGIQAKMNDEYLQGKAMANKFKDGLEAVKMISAGKNAVQGFIDGANSKDVYSVGYRIAQKFLAGLKAGGQEGSPWKTTYRSGIFAGEGLANGIKASEDAVANAGKELAMVAQTAIAPAVGFGELPEAQYSTSITSLAQMALDMGEETEQMETENQPLIVNLEMDGQQIQQVILQDIRRSA